MAGAAGGFVSRAFDGMLKECSGKKYLSLQSAIKSYLDGIKEDKSQGSEELAQKSEQNPDSVAHKSTVQSNESLGPTSVGAEQAGKPLRVNISIATALSTAGYSLEGAQAELVLNPLRLAFETKNMKIVELAMDCLHKLIAYDHLEGDPGLDGGKNAPLFTDILSMVCNCVDNSSLDSTILQVLKVLLTAVASTKFRVHGESLLGVIRVCYNIAIKSKSPINQATSKAMLTQMISIIFRRMESDPSISLDSKELQDQVSIGSDAHIEDTSTSSSKTEVAGSLDDQNEKEVTLGGTLSENQVKDASLASVEELLNLAGGADIKGLEAMLDKAVHLENGSELKCGMDLERMSIGHQDALLLFRTLCQMGMKEDSDDITTKTRILSLEILQDLLEGVSHAFTKNFYFIDSVKAYLSYTLLRASVSSSPVIFQHAAGIFAVLLLRFRETLKGEIGVFFPLIVLRYLDNAECPNQRLSVLRMLEKVCRDPQTLVDTYVNYDCDLDAPNLFQRMVTTLSKIAQLTQASDPNSAAASQNASVKGSSVQCLVNVVKSLVDWEKTCNKSEKQSKDGNSLGEEISLKELVEKEAKEDASSDVEKTKVHKSTTEAAINQAVIGDFLGQQEDFSLSVMHAYVDSMNFSGMTFGAAIREFLGGFRLPGEAQKIDHIMEKFAERYCADNPALFKNADTAYVLAYAVIVLNTDAHNPMVASKMSKADFVRMISMPDAEEAPPTELLEELYDSIVRDEIKLKDDLNSIAKQKSEVEERSRLVSILNLALPRRKSSMETKSEIDVVVKQTLAIFRNQGTKWGLFYTSHKVELLQPMVEAVGWPLLATFSVIMEEGDNKSRIPLCMEGFKAGIHISHALGMDTMRYAFLTSLIRFTFLHAPKEMRSKNVEALRTLLVLCDSDIDSLVDSWNAVLECVSRLEFITSNPAIAATVMLGSNQISRDVLLQSLRELAGEPMEQVFLNSARLPSDAVVEFFTALCGVSGEELKQTPARVFSLEKLVEISYYNMARIRMVWARIWSVLANHFISAGSHHDEKVAIYAVDSLRQLGMKYLERPQLTNFTFQNDILKPFVVLMRNSQSESTRRCIVDCIVQMIKSKVASIKSGWRSVFMVFTAAAADDLEPIVETAFENVEQVILEHFDQVVEDCFMDCVNCLIGFANNKSSYRISLKAIALLRICENRLSEGFVSGGALKPIDTDSSFDVTEHYWFPMLAGLSDLTSDPRAEVRNCALEVLFDLLNERGSKFSSSFWESIFLRVLFPIFDHVRHAGDDTSRSSDNDETLHETCIHSLQLLCNLFNTFYKEVCFMLPPLLSLLLDCAKKPDQSVVSLALGALVHLIEVGGHQFCDRDWDTLLKSIRDASYTTQPLELLNDLGFQHANMPNHLGESKPDDKLVNSTGDDSVNKQQLDANEGVAASHLGRNYSIESFQDSEISEGLPSPTVGSQKHIDTELQHNQSFGQRIMGNMMDNRLVRSFTSKPKQQELDTPVQSQTQLPEAVEHDSKEEMESPLLSAIRCKCITQLLLLGAIDSIQKKYWSKLNVPQKFTVMEILLSILDFAASYNSYTKLRLRVHHVPADRPPLNLLRQELAGTCIYLEMLLKTTADLDTNGENTPETSGFQDSNSEQKLDRVAEEKLVSFCAHVLKEASEFQSSVGENTNMEIHQVLELRSSVIVKVINGMSSMKSVIFRKHLREFYPLLTKLICCDQMDVRRALGDLLRKQLKPLLP